MPRQWHAAVASGGGGLVSDSERTARRALVAVGRHGLGRASEKPLRLRRGSRHPYLLRKLIGGREITGALNEYTTDHERRIVR